MIRRLTWGLLGFLLGAYWMAQADDATQHMVRQRSRSWGRQLARTAERALARRRPAQLALRVGRGAVEGTLQLLRARQSR